MTGTPVDTPPVALARKQKSKLAGPSPVILSSSSSEFEHPNPFDEEDYLPKESNQAVTIEPPTSNKRITIMPLAFPVIREPFLKLVFFVHLILSVWAMQSSWVPQSYMFYNLIFLGSLVWAMHGAADTLGTPALEEAPMIALVIDVVSIILDIVTFSAFYPSSSLIHVSSKAQFSLVIGIFNLIFRLLSCFVIYRVMNIRMGATVVPPPGSPGGGFFGNIGPTTFPHQSVPPANGSDPRAPSGGGYHGDTYQGGV